MPVYAVHSPAASIVIGASMESGTVSDNRKHPKISMLVSYLLSSIDVGAEQF